MDETMEQMIGELLTDTISRIVEVEQECMGAVRKRVDNLTKPPGSLGDLEEMVIRLAGIQRTEKPVMDKKAVVVMCGDHGVVEEGVSAFPSEVTGLMMGNFTRGKAAINVFSRRMGAEVIVVDVGSRAQRLSGVRDEKIKAGTKNMAQGPAMTRDEVVRAIEAGIAIVKELSEQGYKAVALGDMGIGNTTPSAALTAAVTGRPVDELTGKGTGIDEMKRRAKADIIERSLSVNGIGKQWRSLLEPIDVLARVGGLEIAGLVGVTLGAAAHRMAVIVDGVIAGAAALLAYEICPQVISYMFASHLSEEPAHEAALAYLELSPVLHLRMRLGEGSGAVLMFPLLEASIAMLNEMATFDELGL
ncbi:nicotinate-nucleotide--dimethylbenzimidazole phosphoribosyltransferase [Aneurinibacillus aneurinilyticus]|nr:nicotinate-nucleotide--dimethylbenzimidazole phosphoribosyltransferase [Aneurinibacillus aneurinilyticus]MCI1694555.1 nicotinate-nucleotide--dimethylbenzimidazole phosphoribosyltransferase [Aneurinibacillus aneurinilyticus]MED0670920.1 nicotinate-nucleotide--dimethylbenzimidazole phosphoribosyltransferase [Aneurinibacillus aneurinilyticus]MED0705629.1 nicotinate-nucleotide--dimethylbenzimidazole phosphoribosyltransferase [Aneurinibacillus aneurinilyticus]MED0724521.1 nicotinate-nucleotide--d